MIRPNYFFEYLLANLDIIDQAKHNTADFCHELLTKGVRGQTEVYQALNKNSTPYPDLTYQDLAKFAKEVYAIRYQQIISSNSNLVANKDWAPDKISEKECFDMFFTEDQFTQWGFSNQSFFYPPLTEKNKNQVLAEQFLHFSPNGYPEKTKQTDSRNITKRIYFNVSPQNALNITRELAQYAADTGEKVYCKFSTSAKRSDPLLFYTNDEQLPRLLGFLDQLETVHPEYLEPADCRQPFLAPVRPYCGIADEPEDIKFYSNGKEYSKKTSFNYEMSAAIGDFLEIASSVIIDRTDFANATYVIGKDNQSVDAKQYTEYLTWLKFGKTLVKCQEKFKNANSEYAKQQQQLTEELWGQYIEARANPNHYLAKSIAETSQMLYQSIVDKNPATKTSVTIRSHLDYKKFLHSSSDQKEAQESLEKNGYWEATLNIDLNLHSELFKNFAVDQQTQQFFDTKSADNFFASNIEKYLSEHNRSSVISFLNISTVANLNEYWTAKESGIIAYAGSGIAPAEINSFSAPKIRHDIEKEAAHNNEHKSDSKAEMSK